jgi:hypothetical protein
MPLSEPLEGSGMQLLLGVGIIIGCAVSTVFVRTLSGRTSLLCRHLLPFARTLQSKVDSFILALFVLVAPATCYLAIHASVINHWIHFWSLLILGTAPLLYLCAIPQGLWWVPMPPRLITGLSRLLMVLAAFGLLAGGCVRIKADL